MSEFVKATRKIGKLRIGLSGTSGSGKTYSALLLAHGLGGKIALLDTERRASLYADEPIPELNDKPFDFDLVEMTAPYSVERYIKYIKDAESAGYEILIIDSLSHAWAGEGGILDLVEKAAAAGKGAFQSGWKAATPKQNALVDTIIKSNMHIFVTLRTKTEWVTCYNDKGKVEPKKVGTTPVQRDNLEYEFTLFFNIENPSHIATASKDNTHLFDEQFIKLHPDHGKQLREWLTNGETIRKQVDQKKNEEKAQKAQLFIDKIMTATTIDVLKVAFLDAKEFAVSVQDDQLLQRIIKQKDKRKTDLEDSSKPKHVSQVSPEDMDKSWDEFKQEAPGV